jgi:hypothetical protein
VILAVGRLGLMANNGVNPAPVAVTAAADSRGMLAPAAGDGRRYAHKRIR